MATTKFLYDARGHIVREVVTQDLDGKDTFHVHTRQNADPIVRANKINRENHKAGGDLKHVATVPVAIYERAIREGWANDQDAWRRWLNDSDNRDFRVWEGRV